MSSSSAAISTYREKGMSWGLFGLAVLLSFVAFFGGLVELFARWSRQEEYSHGFLIPIVVVGLLWTKRDELSASCGRPSWWGLLAVLTAAAMLIVGELSAFFLLSQVGFVLALMGIVLCFGGWRLLRVAFVPLAFLLFAIPMPYFVDSELSWRLQIISSELGVAFIRLFAIPVYLTGNVIDLGIYKLQVAEACSGLRYLYPLLSFGFLAAYMYQAPFWQRAVVFLSAIPITVLMNSFRIGMIGVLVNYWGIEQAEGLLHFFEGWVIFIACAAILATEILLLARLTQRKSFFEVFGINSVGTAPAVSLRTNPAGPLILASVLLLLGASADYYLSGRQEIIPSRQRFVSFPTSFKGWSGRSSLLDPEIERTLAADDYIVADYAKSRVGPVNFYVAYYGSQRKGSSPHSPVVCIPGGGWQIVNFQREEYHSRSVGRDLPFNRVVIARDKQKELVYYWFVQRGRAVANEYRSKFYLFRDAVFENRTDGALVRVVTPLIAGEPEEAADRRLQQFIDDVDPVLASFLPSGLPKSRQTALR